MSTALPGPSNGPVFPRINGYARSNGSSSNRASWSGSQGSIGSNDGDVGPSPRYPHIKDLQARARAQADASASTHSSVRSRILGTSLINGSWSHC